MDDGRHLPRGFGHREEAVQHHLPVRRHRLVLRVRRGAPLRPDELHAERALLWRNRFGSYGAAARGTSPIGVSARLLRAAMGPFGQVTRTLLLFPI